MPGFENSCNFFKFHYINGRNLQKQARRASDFFEFMIRANAAPSICLKSIGTARLREFTGADDVLRGYHAMTFSRALFPENKRLQTARFSKKI